MCGRELKEKCSTYWRSSFVSRPEDETNWWCVRGPVIPDLDQVGESSIGVENLALCTEPVKHRLLLPTVSS